MEFRARDADAADMLMTQTRDQRFDGLRRQCPACGQLGVRIVYGQPSIRLVEAATRGKVVIGGCTHRNPTHRCPRGHEWHSWS